MRTTTTLPAATETGRTKTGRAYGSVMDMFYEGANTGGTIIRGIGDATVSGLGLVVHGLGYASDAAENFRITAGEEREAMAEVNGDAIDARVATAMLASKKVEDELKGSSEVDYNFYVAEKAKSKALRETYRLNKRF